MIFTKKKLICCSHLFITANENHQHQMERRLDVYHCRHSAVELHQVANVYKKKNKQFRGFVNFVLTYKNLGVFKIRKQPCSRGKTSSKK